LELSAYKDLISPADYKLCEKTKGSRPTWYNLTADVFVKFLYKVNKSFPSTPVFPASSFNHLSFQAFSYSISLQRDISQAADAAAIQYRESTLPDQRTAQDIWDVMSKAQDKTIKRLRSSFEKYICVAHKDNGDEFFSEVLSLLRGIISFTRLDRLPFLSSSPPEY